MARPASTSPTHLLIVEGQSDEHVVRHIWRRHPSDFPFDVSRKDNVEQLLDSIVPEIKAPGRKSMGIIVDANDDLPARWDALTNRLRAENLRLPESPNPTGTIIHSSPRIGIWLMPDNISEGEIEDFVVRMIPKGDPVWPLSQDYIERIPSADRRFSEGKTQRAKLYSWLAAREDPRQMGLAIRTHDLEVDGDLCKTFVAWLAELFR